MRRVPIDPPASVECRPGTIGAACLTEDVTIHIATDLAVGP